MYIFFLMFSESTFGLSAFSNNKIAHALKLVSRIKMHERTPKYKKAAYCKQLNETISTHLREDNIMVVKTLCMQSKKSH